LKNKNYWHLDELMNHLEDKYDVVYKSKQSYYDLFEQGRVSWKRSQNFSRSIGTIFLRNSIRIAIAAGNKRQGFGLWQGAINIHDDFDAPLADF
jgi:hypothetical protein